jgi:hypothetical protein
MFSATGNCLEASQYLQQNRRKVETLTEVQIFTYLGQIVAN